MDTDDLSKETYKGVLITADKFHHDLTTEFGFLAGECTNDNDFLNKSEAMIKEWLSEGDMEDLIEELFSYKKPGIEDFEKILVKLLENIAEVRKIPISKRKFEM
jgi:hypothetical protein